MTIRIRQVVAENRALGRKVDGLAFTGRGRDVVGAIAEGKGLDGASVLDWIANRLLVPKGADWTSIILSEYVGLFDDSSGTFALVWDDRSTQLVAHGAVFQSAANPSAAVVAHIRTADEFKGLGLGTLVTEEVTTAAFRQGAEFVVLATDDKLNRVTQGERAAHRMYSRIGYTILAEKQLADTVDWLMVIDEPVFLECQRQKEVDGGRWPPLVGDPLEETKKALVRRMREQYSEKSPGVRFEPVGLGDLAQLFVLMNLSPADDFRLKLSAWGIHHGPELERSFITAVRPAVADQDRLQEASLVARDGRGAILAVCAAQQVQPFTRRTFAIDFYCLPHFFQSNEATVFELVCRTIARIEGSPAAPRPCWLAFTGVDEAKIELFKSLEFVETGHVCRYFDAHGGVAFEAKEYVRSLH